MPDGIIHSVVLEGEKRGDRVSWICSECGRLHGWWVDKCPCNGRQYPTSIDRSHIARGYSVQTLEGR